MAAQSLKKGLFMALEDKRLSSNLIPRTKKQPSDVINEGFQEQENNPAKTRPNFRHMFKPYTRPVIKRNSNEWYIEYYFLHPETHKKTRFRLRGDLNRIHDLAEREVLAVELCHNLTFALENLAYDPFKRLTSNKLKTGAFWAKQQKKQTRWNVGQACDKFNDLHVKKGLSKASLLSYKNYTNQLKAWVAKNDPDLTLSAIDEPLFEKIMSDLSKDWSARTYNNYVKFFKGFFALCERMERKVHKDVVYQMDFEDVLIKVSKAERHKYFSGQTAMKVKEALLSHPNPYLHLFSQWIYYTCLRPKELSLLKIQYIDLEAGHIKVIGSVAKEAERFLPICNELRELIEQTDLMKQPQHYYVFGNYGAPSDKPFHKDYFSKRFIKIKEKLKLDSNYTLYGWKHTRVIDLIKAGYKDREVMDLTGHKDTKSFDQYKRELMANPDSRLDGQTIKF